LCLNLNGTDLFYSLVHRHGGPAQVRRFLPDLVDRILNRQTHLAGSSTSSCRWTRRPMATRAMDERRAIKVLLRP
jgi:hypothetical protein